MTDNPLEPTPLEQRRAEWLTARRTCITGTDVAKVLGLSKFGGPIDVYDEKTSEAPVEITDNEAMKWGRRNEPTILAAYSEEVAPLRIEQPFTLIRHPSHPLIAATLDARRVALAEPYDLTSYPPGCDGRPVDAKNIRNRGGEWGEAESDVMPLYYAAQLTAQMLVTGATVADLAVLFHGNEFVIYRLHRDEDTVASIVDRCEKFWHNHIVPRVPPPVDGSHQYTEWLKRKFSRHTEVVLSATPEHDTIAQRYREADTVYESAKMALEVQSNALKAQIGEARGIEGNGWKAMWPLTKDSTGVDWEGIAKHIALLYAERLGEPATKIIGDLATSKTFQKVTRKGSRRFTVTFDNEE